MRPANLTTLPPAMPGTLVLVSVDRDKLPAALLDDAKTQMRIRFVEDDAFIKKQLIRAIAWVEANAEISLNPASWDWRLAGYAEHYVAWWRGWWYGYQALELPKRPTRTYTVKDGAGNDVSSYWSTLRDMDSAGIETCYAQRGDVSVETWPITVSMQVGFQDATTMPPLAIDAVLRYTAHLYENREAYQGVQFYEAPDFIRSVLGPLWQPRA